MAQNIVLAKNIDADKLTYDEVKKNAQGGNIVYTKYDGAPKFTVQTCELYVPFGLSTYTDDKTGAVKYSLDISFRGMDDDPKIMQFHNKMQELDEAIIKKGVEKSKEWFGKKLTREVIENFYRPLVKPAKDPEKYAPTMKLKIRTNRSGGIDCDCYDQDRKKVDILEAVVPGSKVTAIMESTSVWFVGKNMFGISWNIVQLKVQKSDKIAGFSFVEEDDPDEAEDVEYEEVEEED